MKLEMYSVYDKAVDAFMQPFFCRTKGEAFRSFNVAVNEEKSIFARNAPDYSLYYVGTWDDKDGRTGDCEPVRIVSATECLQPDR